ncbi:hypothetical protein FNH09_08295 [Streptomyces adustus]|uniref:Uncharacterized protein n=1 Tax=Streptomyces adustus TaxID=1609272 RepID=A0A5N8V878_9ACTN|nr:DUF6415 family natural product biosynthesis protein [Streptomyces adustus]MPY31299.1 hypothetical protein [Streptomyces adustus]
MEHGSAAVEDAAGRAGHDLPDIATMRERAAYALSDQVPDDGWETLTELFRGSICELIPACAALIPRVPKGDTRRVLVAAAVDEARRKLRIGDGGTVALRQSRARKLARCVSVLCHHYEDLTSADA